MGCLIKVYEYFLPFFHLIFVYNKYSWGRRMNTNIASTAENSHNSMFIWTGNIMPYATQIIYSCANSPRVHMAWEILTETQDVGEVHLLPLCEAPFNHSWGYRRPSSQHWKVRYSPLTQELAIFHVSCLSPSPHQIRCVESGINMKTSCPWINISSTM